MLVLSTLNKLILRTFLGEWRQKMAKSQGSEVVQ